MRLTKFWNKTLFIDEFIPNRSTIIELVAIDAAKKEESKFFNCLSRAFFNFLKSMSEFDELVIIYEVFYNRNHIDKLISKQKPLILDPTNPYFNVANIQISSIKMLKDYASETLNRWENPIITPDLNKLFEPQP